jgi:phage terminase Nu1 subunit (DNA packaging protein)
MVDMNKRELAKGLGISRQMAHRLAALGMPTDTIEGARAWRKRHLRSKPKANGQSHVAARTRLVCLQAELLELELAEKRGALVPWDAVVPSMQKLVMAARDRFLRVSQQCRERFPDTPAEMFTLIEELHRQALTDLAEGAGRLNRGNGK